jgi:hypothetical protein
LSNLKIHRNCIGGVIFDLFAPSAVDCGSKPRSGQTKYDKIGVLVKYKADIIFISSNVTCSHHEIAEKLLIWSFATINYSLKRQKWQQQKIMEN